MQTYHLKPAEIGDMTLPEISLYLHDTSKNNEPAFQTFEEARADALAWQALTPREKLNYNGT